ncbi:MAG: saccharopine dehydrogenase [Rhodobacteraceae bacterium]|nr:saccharopine dehydrogenase [Paracoccaceae bacterium]
MKFILRDEARTTERRTPITPDDAKQFLAAGYDLSVERSAKRIFTDAEYAAAGCILIDAQSWQNAPADTTILGLKELPETPAKLRTPFIHFAHIFKDQTGWKDELARFTDGGGCLYDLEYLTINNRRTAAFGYWAGWMGAALAAWRQLAAGQNKTGPEVGVSSFDDRAQVETILRDLSSHNRTAVVIGAKGRSGAGATEALTLAGYKVTEWDIAETKNLDRAALLTHDLLVNCVLMTGPGLQLLTKADLGSGNLSMISDVSCDPFSDYNPLPIYDAPTAWDAPFIDLGNGVELTAIDNLPSLLPREASVDFSSQLLKSLLSYPDGPEWQAAANTFTTGQTRADA